MDHQAYQRAVWHITGLDKRYKTNKAVGWVYAMRNSAFRKPLLKIGMTSRPPFERAQDLGRATGVPGAFELVYFIHVSDRRAAEHLLHQRLDRYRTSAYKEFFEVTVSKVVDAMDEAAAAYPIAIGGRWPNIQYLPQVFAHTVIVCPHCGQKNKVRALAVAAFRPTCGKCRRNLLGPTQ